MYTGDYYDDFVQILLIKPFKIAQSAELEDGHQMQGRTFNPLHRRKVS